MSVTLALAFILVHCQASESPMATSPTPVGALSPDRLATLGDIDPDEPAKKIKRFQPLADYLAEHLTGQGIERGRVVIARDIEEMASFLKDGTVDIYFDSAFPTLVAEELAGSEVILRRWKQGDPTYWSTYAVRRDSAITSLEDLTGTILAMEEPHSTSGFVLPAGTLIQRGFKLRKVESLDADVAPHEIGYFFSWDEENTIELVLNGHVAAGAISNQDYEELPAELKEHLITIGRTLAVPRQLVSVRGDLDLEVKERVGEVLTGLDQTPEGQELLKSLNDTKKFDALPPDSEAGLTELRELMKLALGG